MEVADRWSSISAAEPAEARFPSGVRLRGETAIYELVPGMIAKGGSLGPLFLPISAILMDL